MLFHQGNAPRHKLIVTIAKLHELHFELLPHPPYSSNLAPNDYRRFAGLKRMLQAKRFDSNEDVISESEAKVKPKSSRSTKKALELVRSPRRGLCW